MKFLDSSNSFAAGRLGPKLYGRTNIPQYTEGLAEANNVLLMKEGGVRHPTGTVHLEGSTLVAQDAYNALTVDFATRLDAAHGYLRNRLQGFNLVRIDQTHYGVYTTMGIRRAVIIVSYVFKSLASDEQVSSSVTYPSTPLFYTVRWTYRSWPVDRQGVRSGDVTSVPTYGFKDYTDTEDNLEFIKETDFSHGHSIVQYDERTIFFVNRFGIGMPQIILGSDISKSFIGPFRAWGNNAFSVGEGFYNPPAALGSSFIHGTPAQFCVPYGESQSGNINIRTSGVKGLLSGGNATLINVLHRGAAAGTFEIDFPESFDPGEGNFFLFCERLQPINHYGGSDIRAAEYLVGSYFLVGGLKPGTTRTCFAYPVDFTRVNNIFAVAHAGGQRAIREYDTALITGTVESWRVSAFGRGIWPEGATVQDNRLVLYTSKAIFGSAVGNPFFFSNIRYPQNDYVGIATFPELRDADNFLGLKTLISTNQSLIAYSGAINNTDPYNFTIASNKPLNIQFITAIRDMVVGTTEGVFVNSTQGILGPRNVGFTRQVRVPCDREFETSSRYVFFSTNNGSTLEMMSYVRESGAMVNTELSLLSEDLYEGRKIKKLSFNYLSKILFVLFDDGGVVGVTVEDGANIKGHSRFTFPGDVSDLAYLEDFNKTVLYFIPQHSPDVLYGFLDSEIQVVNPVTGDADITSWLAVDNTNIAGNPRIEQANADSRFFFNERNSPNLFLWDLDAFPKTDKEYLYFQRTYTSMTPKTVWAVEGYFFARGTTVRAFFNNDLSSLEFPGNEDNTITLPFAVDEVTIGYIIQPEIRTLYLAPPQNQVPGGRGMQVFTQRVDLVGIRLFRTDQFEIRILSQEDREDDINTPVETSGQGDEIPLLAPDSRYYKVQVGSSMDIAPQIEIRRKSNVAGPFCILSLHLRGAVNIG